MNSKVKMFYSWSKMIKLQYSMRDQKLIPSRSGKIAQNQIYFISVTKRKPEKRKVL